MMIDSLLVTQIWHAGGGEAGGGEATGGEASDGGEASSEAATMRW